MLLLWTADITTTRSMGIAASGNAVLLQSLVSAAWVDTALFAAHYCRLVYVRSFTELLG